MLKIVSEIALRKVSKYIIERYLGHYLQEKLKYDQLRVSLDKNKTANLNDLTLDVDALNEMADKYNLPLEFLDGYIKNINVTFKLESFVFTIGVQGLKLTIQPKHRLNNASVMDSIVGSVMMTTSMQLSRECLANEDFNKDNDKGPERIVEGVEQCAVLIDSIFRKIKVTFVDTTLRLEHVPNESETGIGVEITIQKISYYDETTTENANQSQPNAFSCKVFIWDNIVVQLDEFPRNASLSKSSLYMEPENKNAESYSTAPETPEPNTKSSTFETCSNSDDIFSSAYSNFAAATDPIVIAKLPGSHQIRLRLKQLDCIYGPKISADITLHSAVAFLTPRQLYIFNELLGGFISPNTTNDYHNLRHTTSLNKPMKPSDFELVEKELQNKMNLQGPDRSVFHRPGWSSQCLEDSDDEFLPFGGSECKLTSSVLSQSSNDSTSAHSQDERTPRQNQNIHSTGEDSLVESTEFKFRLNCLIIILLHDDILTYSATSTRMIIPSSVTEMKMRSEGFFNELGSLDILNNPTRIFGECHSQLNSLCRNNHLRFVGAPCTIDITDKTLSNIRNLETVTSFGNAELVECLFDDVLNSNQSLTNPTCCHLLKFNQVAQDMSESCVNLVSRAIGNPSFKMKINYLENIVVMGQRGRNDSSPRSDIEFDLAPCTCDLDISIVDRISNLLHGKDLPGKPMATASRVNGHNLNQVISENTHSGAHRLDLKFSSSSLTLKIRFPIPDLRPLADMNRAPWWKQTIRKDAVFLVLVDARLHTLLNKDNTSYSIDARCKELIGSYQENSSDPLIQFLRAFAGHDDGNSSNDEMGWPRISFKIKPPTSQSILEESDRDDDSNYGCSNGSIEALVSQLCNIDKDGDGPFSPRKLIYESDKCSNDRGSSIKSKEEKEEEKMSLPKDRKEALDFIESSNANCHYLIDISVENLNIVLPSKHFYEILYNRITVDLLLWEPTVIVPATGSDSKVHFTNSNTMNWSHNVAVNNAALNAGFQNFSMCTSALKYESGSESEDEQQAPYFSFYDQKHKMKKSNDTNLRKLQHKSSFTINSKNVSVELILPLRDSFGKVVPECEGKLQVIATDCSFYTLATGETNPETSYMCFHANSAEVYHEGCTSTTQFESHLFDDNIKFKKNLILHVTENEAKPRNSPPTGCGGESMDVLSLAIKSCLDTERNVKKFRMALSIHGATLHYYMTPNPESWFSQIIDFFDVIDYPVMGYQFPEVITELYLHTWDCSVDYRPLYLPLRVFLTMQSFSVSSNITAQTTSSVVRVITEDVYLFLSKKCSSSSVNLKKDYVCVLDFSFFELLLKISDGSDPQKPKIDLQTFINVLFIRTCVDSCLAIQDLLRYFANDGDLRSSEQEIDEEETMTNFVTPADDTDNHMVNTLMEEAMEESTLFPNDGDENERLCTKASDHTSDLFLFPGERESHSQISNSRLYPSLGNELFLANEGDSSESDFDDFCILEDDPGVGIMPPRSGEPQIRVLSNEPINIIENHFSVPKVRVDLLKAPRHFPPASVRYKLNEISIVWSIYGGSDFPVESSNKNEHKVKKRMKNCSGSEVEKRRLENLSRNQEKFPDMKNVEVSFNKAKHEVTLNSGSSPASINKSPSSPPCSSSSSKLIMDGGPERQYGVFMQLQLTKVRFQHESYPEPASQASRQVLLVNNIEIIDRLASSYFNKFLYYYYSENMPKQSYADMLTVKALHRRTDPGCASQECDLKVAMLPLRLNIDQDALIFLSEFFGSLTSSNNEYVQRGSDFAKCNRNVLQAPIRTVACKSTNESLKNSSTGLVNSESQSNLIQFDDVKSNSVGMRRSSSVNGSNNSSPTPSVPLPIFFSSFEFVFEVLIRFDYQGKHVSLEQGAIAGLLMGIGQLNNSELRLKRLSYRGVLGVDRLIHDAINEWLQDIKQNQLPSILSGVGPLHSVVQLMNGIHSLFWLPIEQYRKDGRIVRGIQRGANAFTTSTTMAFLELANRLVITVQSTAETAYNVVSPGPSAERKRKENRGSKMISRQPLDLREGMTNAYHVVKEGLGDTAMTLMRVASQEHEQKGISGAFGGVLRQIPPTMVKPIILATEATSNMLGGLKHQIAPDTRKEAAEKWRLED